MTDRFLRLAFRLTRGHLAERISQLIWSRECDRRWARAVADHKAAGGSVLTVERPCGGVDTTLI